MSTKPRLPGSVSAYLLSAGLGLVALGCLETRSDKPNPSRECTACHGDASRSDDQVLAAAPPFDVDGKTEISSPGVGAHAQHLSGKGHRSVACTECHIVPESVYSKGHVDSDFPAELTFGELAKQGDRAPAYDAKTRSCSDSYCHGSAEVTWTKPRSQKDSCGTCHGLPPALPHPHVTDCSQCHGEVIAKDGTFIRPDKHVDGKVEVQLSSQCNACHGSEPNGGPPPDLSGSTAPSSRGAGAHATHLVRGATHEAVACTECHVVPSTVEQSGHIDSDGRAEVTFGALAKNGNHSPTYAAASQSCGSTYCHGSAAPAWTNPRSSDKACGSCHGLPPALPHPQNSACSQCHSATIRSDRTFAKPELHVNGTVEFGTGALCAQCHGTAADGAPPKDLSGNTAVSAPGVGAHQNHLTSSGTHAPIACTECHRVPGALDSAGHLDGDNRAEVTFGTLARTGGAVANYARETQSCNSTYCHGSATPAWTAPKASAEACGTCHGLPPALPHPQAQDCSQCHSAVVRADKTFLNPALHVNGTVEFGTGPACSQCHGSTDDGAPPKDLSGNTATTAVGVGAHQLHLTGSATHSPIACSECHAVPATLASAGHVDGDGRAEVTFGALARNNGALGTYAADSHSCSSTYCHGNASPVWTLARTSAQACGTCHGLPPALPHPQNPDCSQCHGMVVLADKTFVSPELHVNGTVDMSSGPLCASCHGSTADGAPPKDLSGSSSTASRGVGAHQIHLTDSPTHGKLACTECHLVPAAKESVGHLDGDGRADVTFGALAKTSGMAPTYDAAAASCSNTYCHRSTVSTWQAPRTSAAACGTCHALPPPAPHPARQDCSACHGDVIAADRSFVAPSRHVDGKIDLSGTGCNLCHGSAANAAPPMDISGSSDPTRIGIGAHQAHVKGGKWSRPVPCSDCHLVPATIYAPGHLDDWSIAEVEFSGAATAKSNRVTWNRTTATCAGSYCHDPLGVGNQPPPWTASGTSFTCTSCHQMPPPAPHTTNTQCSTCHTDVDSANNIFDPSQHINGTVDLF